jgi:CRISPR-associated protein Cas2
MYVVIVYDSDDSVKFHKYLKKFLFWKQNSVFYGELTEGKFKKIQNKINEMLSENDSIIIFSNNSSDFIINKYGKEKDFDGIFI